jgi:hypothetical protein
VKEDGSLRAFARAAQSRRRFEPKALDELTDILLSFGSADASPVKKALEGRVSNTGAA